MALSTSNQVTASAAPGVCEEHINQLGILLLGGDGAPAYAPNGLLRLRGISVEELARSCDLTRTAIYNYIHGINRPTASTLRRICEALQIGFDEGRRFCDPAVAGRPTTDALPVNQYDPGDLRDMGTTDGTMTDFSLKLQQLMREHHPAMSIRDLSNAIGMSYEHARRLKRGTTSPSGLLIRRIAEVFGAPLFELQKIDRADRLRREFGHQAILPTSSPELQAFIDRWPTLTSEQRQLLTAQLRMFSEVNEKLSRAGA